MVYGQQKHVKVESIITFANFVHLLIQHTQLGLSSWKTANSRSRSYRTSTKHLLLWGTGELVLRLVPLSILVITHLQPY